MNRSACLVVLTSICFFALFRSPKPFRAPEKVAHEKVLRGLPAPTSPGAALWRGLVVGDTRGLSRSEIRTYYQLGLGHLFTPSGVHLATLAPLWSLVRWPTPLFLLLALGALAVPGFGALARVAFVKALPRSLFGFGGFSVVLSLEGMLSSWSTAALSWTCSWLFLGLSWFAPARQRFLWFVLAQILLCWVLSKPFSLIAPLVNLAVAVPLAGLFPLALGLSVVPSLPTHSWLVEIFGQLHGAILWVDRIHSWLPPLAPHVGHVGLLLLWILARGQRKLCAAPLLLLFLSQPLNQFAPKAPAQHKWEVALPSEVQQVGNSVYAQGWKCQQRWRNNRWEIGCRPGNQGGRKKTRKLSSTQ